LKAFQGYYLFKQNLELLANETGINQYWDSSWSLPGLFF